jgi:hypothetical protein
VLFTMHDLKNNWNLAYKKSARIVGDCIGKCHLVGEVVVQELGKWLSFSGVLGASAAPTGCYSSALPRLLTEPDFSACRGLQISGVLLPAEKSVSAHSGDAPLRGPGEGFALRRQRASTGGLGGRC